jgi:adenine phosphoribosyltransferase
VKELRELIRTIPDHPRPGIMFRDITTLLGDAEGFAAVVDAIAARHRGSGIAKVAGIEARGFILGGAVALRIGAGFIPVRKKGKLPWEVVGHDYALEYGTDRVEIHRDAVTPGERVLIVDDLIATGGTAEAAIRLVETLGGVIAEACFVIDLPGLGGSRRIEALGHRVFSLLPFEGE